MKLRPLNMYVRPSKEVGRRPVIKSVEVNKRTFFTYGKKNKVDFLNKKKVNEKIKNFFYTFNILIGYPILILTLAGLLLYCPEVLLLTTIVGNKIFDYFSKEASVSLVVDNTPLIEYLTLNEYSLEEYLIYKYLFTDNITCQEASEKINSLQKRLEIIDLNIVKDRSQVDLLHQYIDQFIMETSKPKSEYAILRMFHTVLDFFAQKEYFLKVKFTAEGEIPTLTLQQYYRLAENRFEDLAELRSHLSISSLNELNESSREEVPFIAQDVPTANHDVPVEPNKRNKPANVNFGPAVSMETVNSVRAALVKLDAGLQESDQMFTEGQNELLNEFNKKKDEILTKKQDLLSKATTQLQEVRLEKAASYEYQKLTEAYEEIKASVNIDHTVDYQKLKEETLEKLKELALDIDVSKHPVMVREPAVIVIPQDMNEDAKVKRI